MKKTLFILFAAIMLASCGSKKNLTQEPLSQTGNTVTSLEPVSYTAFMKKVNDNAVDVQNIVADLDFTLASGGKDVTVGGSLHMKKDDVIRIQLVALGLMEVGRLEFTKDYVLIMDKIHKKYVQEDYNNVSFLKDNGLDFSALQALLWNQLYIPGSKDVSEFQLKEFVVNTASGAETSNIVLDRGNFKFNWLANNSTALLENVDVNYKSNSHGSTNVNCKYSKFVNMGAKKFPSNIQLTLETSAIKSAKTMRMGFALSDFSNSDKWDKRTVPSKKYEKIGVEQMLQALMSLSK